MELFRISLLSALEIARTSLSFLFFLPLHELFVRKLNLVMMCSCVAKRFVMCMQLKMDLLANYNVICAYQEMFPFV